MMTNVIHLVEFSINQLYRSQLLLTFFKTTSFFGGTEFFESKCHGCLSLSCLKLTCLISELCVLRCYLQMSHALFGVWSLNESVSERVLASESLTHRIISVRKKRIKA